MSTLLAMALGGCDSSPAAPPFLGDPGAFESRAPVPALATAAPGWVVRVAAPDRALVRFALAGGFIYFAAKDAGLYRVPTSGGPIEVVEAGAKTIYTEVAAGSGEVYWLKTTFDALDHPHASVRHQPAGGATIATRFEGEWSTLWSNTAFHFQADAYGVYVNETPPGSRASGIQNLPAQGGTPIEMLAISDVSQSPVWTVDDMNLYFTFCEQETCQLSVVSKVGGVPHKLAELPATFVAIRAIDEAGIYLSTSTAIWRVSKQGGVPLVLFTLRGAVVSPHLAIDGQNLFFVERRNGSYRVRSVPKAGGVATVIAAAAFPKGINQMVLDDAHVYLLHGADEILAQSKLPAPPTP